ncbi:intein-containing Rv2578c family radical SAM protein [Amycolatopsis cihanbeyliensis]|uniref:Intein/intein n=1 Tax=Amycolatopsis cihanbeyliensis TaxID=1128664 RepID=A0A542DDT4_AMYCI|nr:intein-containing Rv2578c family radical SAM protein [Amycolatopsis cihanbeyliensis]TQJ01231.1 intein/intein [Amycolatopsis cihanbeyliensis]
MRWDGQRADETEPEQALLGLSGLIRSVRSPDFSGVTFHEVRARSVLNKMPKTSSMPFRWTVNPYRGCSHACTYCLSGDTAILMADGRTKPLADLAVGDEIYGTYSEQGRRRYVRTHVLAHWSTVKPAYRVTLEDGTELVASGDHRFLTERGWKHVTGSRFGAAQRPHLTTRNRLVGTGPFAPPPEEGPEYRVGYLCGALTDEGDTAPAHRFRLASPDREMLRRAREYLTAFGVPVDESVSPPGVGARRPGGAAGTAGQAALAELFELPVHPGTGWQKGFLAGVFDARGRRADTELRLTGLEPDTAEAARLALTRLVFRHTVEDGGRTIRLSGGVEEQLRFFHTVDPAAGRKRMIDGAAVRGMPGLAVAAVEPTGLELPLFDITTGTGDFIANGVVSHNCFARKSHTYLDFDSGLDFDTQVVVKVNAPDVLAAQVRKPGWAREHVAMGTNTDPYQRAEGRYQLMPGIIRALADSGTPFSILTKGTVLTRDLPLLESVSADVSVGLGVSIALLDRELQRRLEPGTPSPQARLELVRRAAQAGLPCGVMVAPVLPGLTDSMEALDGILGAVADAGASGVTVLPLHLRPGAREWFLRWLGAHHPELVPRYRELYAGGSYVNRHYRNWLGERVGRLLRRHGLDQGGPGHRDGGEGAVPIQRAPEHDASQGGDQLSLL